MKLLRAVDPRKDQTFFLSQVPQHALRYTMFPLGAMLKKDVKRLADDIGLKSIVKKRESMGICFIGKRKFGEFMSEYVISQPGAFVNIDNGIVVGKHNGIHKYTIGQGVLISGQKEKLFAVRKLADQQTILVAAGTKHPSMLFDLFYTKHPHWIDKSPFESENRTVVTVEFRFQHGHRLEKCMMFKCQNGLFIKLEKPIRAICAGQFAVFYRGNECLGSAQILASGPSLHSNSNTLT